MSEAYRRSILEDLQPLDINPKRSASGRAFKKNPAIINIPEGTDLEEIGSGGQAIVYACFLEIQGSMQKVAVKKYEVRCSEKELSMLRKLEHKNIVKFFGQAMLHDEKALVLEFCESTLRNRLSRHPLDKISFTTIASETAAGIQYLHANNVIHRDIKPENVLIDVNGISKLCDFGIARDSSGHSTQITVVGSRAYMAPELIRGEKCSNKIDVWSFGIVLWEMVTGKYPYEGIEGDAVPFAVGNNKARLPVPETSAVESLLLMLRGYWAIDPHERYSIDEVLKRLNDVTEELAELNDEEWTAECARWTENVNEVGFWDEESGDTTIGPGQRLQQMQQVMQMAGLQQPPVLQQLQQALQPPQPSGSGRSRQRHGNVLTDGLWDIPKDWNRYSNGNGFMFS